MGNRRRSRRRRKQLLRFSPYIVVIGIATSYLIKSYGGEILEDYRYSSLRDNAVSEPKKEASINERQVKESAFILALQEKIQEEIEALDNEKEIVIEDELEEVIEEKVEVISDELLTLGYDFRDIDFSETKSKNEDTCGWIVLDGTNIDYPIVNATDEENIYYAHHDLEGNYTKSGTVYVDTRCNSLENATYDLSDVTLIYGHHMKHGKMFANLCKFQSNENFIDDHQFAIIYTPDGYAYKLTFFAGIRFSGKSDKPVYRESLEDEEVFNEYIENLKANSSFTSDVEVNYGDKIIGLITCEYTGGNNSRYGLFAIVEKQYINELQMENSIDTIDNVSYGLK